jgi:hypothetical protein
MSLFYIYAEIAEMKENAERGLVGKLYLPILCLAAAENN